PEALRGRRDLCRPSRDTAAPDRWRSGDRRRVTRGKRMPTQQQRPLSPELLNQNITLVKAPSWILVVVMLGVMASALLWGIFGTVLVQITGRGLLVHADNQQVPLLAIERAQLLKAHVAIGD